jgi:hypothetical protein
MGNYKMQIGIETKQNETKGTEKKRSKTKLRKYNNLIIEL